MIRVDKDRNLSSADRGKRTKLGTERPDGPGTEEDLLDRMPPTIVEDKRPGLGGGGGAEGRQKSFRIAEPRLARGSNTRLARSTPRGRC